MNEDLPEELRDYVAATVACGRFATAGVAIAEAVRRMRKQEPLPDPNAARNFWEACAPLREQSAGEGWDEAMDSVLQSRRDDRVRANCDCVLLRFAGSGDRMPTLGVEELTTLVTAPAAPVAARGDWSAVERAIGLTLPDDFKALIGTYGEGVFGNLVCPLNPFRRGLDDYLRGVESLLREEREEREFRPLDRERESFPIHPEPGGLFPWAATTNGDTLYWLPEGGPERWTVVFVSPRGEEAKRYGFGCVEFLVRWFLGALAWQRPIDGVRAFWPVGVPPETG